MKKILLELPDELADQVDQNRGNQPRVAWIRDAIADALSAPQETPAPSHTQYVERAGLTVPERTVRQPLKVEDGLVAPPPIAPRETIHKLREATAEICHHPITRRIGTMCAACGKDPVK